MIMVFFQSLNQSHSRAFDLAKPNEGEYDLCLMDIDMPVMDGWEPQN